MEKTPCRAQALKNLHPNPNLLYQLCVLPKLDDLRLMCTLEKPDVVCIVETWLCSDITNNEIAIPEYTVHRLDRDRHGGGILIYCHCHLNIILSKNTNNPMSLWQYL